MKEAAQVVLLIDVDSVRDQQLETVRRICLRLLTCLATTYCSSGARRHQQKQVRRINLKFGYKFYGSIGARPSAHQRHNFVDFNIDSFEDFERNLRLVCDGDCGGLAVTSRAVSSVAGRLERALKDLLCDYVWDNPSVSSPVRSGRRCGKGGRPRDSDEERTTDNYVVLLARAPPSLDLLRTLVGGRDEHDVTTKEVLDWLLPATVRRMFHNTLHIGLVWVDLFTSSFRDDNFNYQQDDGNCSRTFRLLDAALRRIDGGLIPANAILPHLSASSPGQATAVPQVFQLVSPVASLIERIVCRPHTSSPSVDQHAELHLKCDGDSAENGIRLELLPLFKCSARCCSNNGGTKSSGPPVHNDPPPTKASKSLERSAVTTSTTRDTASLPTIATSAALLGHWIPRTVRVVGTMSLAEVHERIMARPLAFVCCEALTSGRRDDCSGSPLFSELLRNLKTRRLALVVSCDSTCLGIMLPATNRCQVAQLHVLVSTENMPLMRLKMSSAATSPVDDDDPDIGKFVRRLLANWEIPDVRCGDRQIAHQQSQSHPSLSLSVIEKGFLSCHCDRNLMDEIQANRNHSALAEAHQKDFSMLQNLYLPAEPFAKSGTPQKPKNRLDRVESHNDGLRRSPRINKTSMNVSHRVMKIVSKSIMSKRNRTSQSDLDSSRRVSSDSNLSQGDSNRTSRALSSGTSEKFVSPAPANERDVVDSVQTMYNSTVSGNKNLLAPSQDIISFVLVFFKSEDEDAQVKIKEFLTNNVLLTAGQVSKKYNAAEVDYPKNQRIREYCFQVLLWLEWMSGVKLVQDEASVDQIISHLRMLPFVAGPTEFSKFLNDIVIERYYPLLKEVVVTICEELNQPLPLDGRSSSPEVTLEDCELRTPDKMSSVPSQISAMDSNLSSCSSQSHSRRGDVIRRHPSFATVGSSRQIVVPQVRSRSWKEMPPSERITRSAEKKKSEFRRSSHQNRCSSEATRRNGAHRSSAAHGFVATQMHFTPPKHKKPTTPNGRHVLKTQVIADTPTHKQVANAILHKQALGRKRNFVDIGNESLVVEESPDEKRSGVTLRRSPRTHATVSLLQRKSSFYTIGQESKSRHVEKARTEELARIERKTSDTSFLLLDVTQSPWAKFSPRGERPSADKEAPCTTVTPNRRARVKRHLSLSGSFSPPVSKTRKENVTPGASNHDVAAAPPSPSRHKSPATKRSARVKLFGNLETTKLLINHNLSPSPRRSLRLALTSPVCGNPDSSVSRTRSAAKRNGEEVWNGNKWLSTVTDSPRDAVPSESCSKIQPPKMAVSRQLLQTPAKCAGGGRSETDEPVKQLNAGSNDLDESSTVDNDYFVPRTPQSNDDEDDDCLSVKSNGQSCLFPPGLLALDHWEEHMSRSSSPMVPLIHEFIQSDVDLGSTGQGGSSECDDRGVEDRLITTNESSSAANLATSPPLDSTEPESLMFSSADSHGADVDESSASEEIVGGADCVGPLIATKFVRRDNSESQVTHHLELAEIYHRFTRRASKEIGITPDDLWRIANDSFTEEPSPGVVTNARKRGKTTHGSPSKNRRDAAAGGNCRITPPSVSSLLHLTDSPIVSPTVLRQTRNSKKRVLS